VKAEIIVKALAEESDLEALRAEKRAILQEEQRLKALLGMEKVKLHRKADMQAAVRAERQRVRSKREFRRDKYAALQKQRQSTARLHKMLAAGLVTDPKTGTAVPVESEEGWFALQELDRAGGLPDAYRAFLDGEGDVGIPGAAGSGAGGAGEAEPGVGDPRSLPAGAQGSFLTGSAGPSTFMGASAFGSAAEVGSPGPSTLEAGGTIVAGRVAEGGGGTGMDAIDAIAGTGGEGGADAGGSYSDEYDDDGELGDEQPSVEDASLALSRLREARE